MTDVVIRRLAEEELEAFKIAMQKAFQDGFEAKLRNTFFRRKTLKHRFPRKAPMRMDCGRRTGLRAAQSLSRNPRVSSDFWISCLCAAAISPKASA